MSTAKASLVPDAKAISAENWQTFYHWHFACRNSYFLLVWSKNNHADVSHNWQKRWLRCVPGRGITFNQSEGLLLPANHRNVVARSYFSFSPEGSTIFGFRKRLDLIFGHRLTCIVITIALYLRLFDLGNTGLHIFKEEQNIRNTQHRFLWVNSSTKSPFAQMKSTGWLLSHPPKIPAVPLMQTIQNVSS